MGQLKNYFEVVLTILDESCESQTCVKFEKENREIVPSLLNKKV